MRKVAIASYGTTKFSMNNARTESVLAQSAVDLFTRCKDMDRNLVDSVLVSTNSNEKYMSPILSEMVGIRPNAAHTVESMCSSGTSAIVSAYSYIAAGLADVVLVSGAEIHDSPGRILEWDDSRGEFKHPIYWASIFTNSYKQRHFITDKDLAVIPVKNHMHASFNPDALSEKTCTIQDVMDSKRLTDDMRLLDCSRPCTGGASILLASGEKARQITDIPVWITGIGQKTTSAGFAKNPPSDMLESTRIAARNALQMSGHDARKVDVAEVHDAFSVCEPMALESIGLAGQGRGIMLARETYETKSFKINPRGGLIGAGHPLGATGVAQAAEIARQLQNAAGSRQVDSPHVGLVHNMAAAATSSTILVLEK